MSIATKKQIQESLNKCIDHMILQGQKIFELEHQIHLLENKLSGDEEEVSIEELEISLRTKNSLLSYGISTISQLQKKRDLDLLVLPNVGKKTIREIKSALDIYNLSKK